MFEIQRKTAIALAAALALAVTPAFAGDDADAGDEPKVFERQIVVRDGEGAEPEVMFWSSDDEKGSPRRIPFDHLMMLGRGYIGVVLTDLPAELRQHFGIQSESGVIVSTVEKDGPAEKAGLEIGDVIVQVDDQPVRHSGDLARGVRKHKAGETVRVEVLRAGRLHGYDVAVAERDRRLLALEGLPEKIEMGEFHPAMERAFRVMDDPAFKERVRAVHDREKQLEERLKQLEQRLQDMEKRLRDNK